VSRKIYVILFVSFAVVILNVVFIKKTEKITCNRCGVNIETNYGFPFTLVKTKGYHKLGGACLPVICGFSNANNPYSDAQYDSYLHGIKYGDYYIFPVNLFLDILSWILLGLAVNLVGKKVTKRKYKSSQDIG